MSNIVNLPPNRESGLYIAPSHEEGGVQVIVDGVTKVEVEGDEIHLCKFLMQSEEIHEFKGVTNKELLDELFKINKCVFEQGKANSGDFIVCKLVVNDEKKRDITGTAKEIVNILQDEKSCNVTEDIADRVNREGGVLTAEDEANVRLDFLKRMQRKKPSKETATKIRVLTKMIGSGHYKNGGAVKKKELNIDYVPDLIAVHNLNYSNLLFADKLGGISMPSLAIIRIDNPLTDYGDITLVAPKSFIDPEENSSARVFNRDVYSPTYPKVYSHVDKSALSKLEADFYQKKRDWTIYADEATRYDLAYFIEDLSNGKHLPDVLDKAVSNSFIVYLWAKENNIELEIPIENYDFRYWTYNPDTDSAFMLSLNEKYPVLWNAVTKDVYDFGNEELEKELAAAFRENYMEYNVGKLEDGDLKDAKIQILENFFEDGELQTTHSYGAFKNLVLAAKEKKKVNTDIWRERVKTISDDNTHAIRDFIKSMIDKVMWGSYFFRTKSTKLETSLSNIYDYMGSKAVKSSEETLVHGLGKAASMGAKEYDSLVAVARDKDNFLVSTEAFNEYKKKQDVLWNNVTSKIRQYYKYGNDNISFQALDLLSKSIGQISQYKNPSDEKISQILSKNDYGKTPSYLYDVIREFTECLKNAPTEYFEVKMTSIVKIESFIGAIVPKELVEDVTPLLHKHGIKNISVYNKDDYENRNRFISDAIREVVDNSKETILFRKGGNLTDEPTKDKTLIGLHLPVEMSVYVPSTKDADVPVSKNELEERVNTVRGYLANLFGGFSSSDVIGGYVSNSKELIKEDVVKVIAFATKDAYKDNKEKLAHQIAKWAKEWSQEAIGFELEGDLYYINQESIMRDGGTINYVWTMKDLTEKQIAKLRKLEKTAMYYLDGNKKESKKISDQQDRWFKEAVKIGVLVNRVGSKPENWNPVKYSVNGEVFNYEFHDVLA